MDAGSGWLRRFLLPGLAATVLAAMSIGGAGAAPDVAGGRALTADDAEAWLDGYMPYALGKGGIPGSVVVIVKDGKILLAKGYGLADVATGKPVDADRTLFRLGSVSKLFTWTAVLQLAEQGRLDLDADINGYLDFPVPPRDGKPVTLRHLLTHTAGFDETTRGIAVRQAADLTTLGEALRQMVPDRVFDAGTTPAYSNYGTGLAGYIVERVSGEPFNDYVRDHVFRLLGMSRTTLVQPLPPELRDGMSAGYLGPASQAEPFENVAWQPAGAGSGTGTDMGRFMIAHLQLGQLGGARILSPETARMMQAAGKAYVPPLNAMALGFYEKNINGRRVVAHAGDTQLFHSLLTIWPDDNVGMFVSLNGAGADDASGEIRQALFEGFSDRYLPGGAPDGTVDAATAAAHAAMFRGTYALSRSWHSSFLSVLTLPSQMTVAANPDGTISASGLKTPAGAPIRFREIAPFVWREAGGHERLAAVVQDGRVVRLSVDSLSPVMVFDAVPWHRSASLLIPAVGAAVVVLLLTALAWPVAAFLRRRGLPIRNDPARRRSRVLTRVASLPALAALAGWAWVMSLLGRRLGVFLLFEHDGGLLFVQALTIAGLGGGTVAALANLLVVWKAWAHWTARAWAVVLLLSLLALLWTAWSFQLMGLSTRY